MQLEIIMPLSEFSASFLSNFLSTILGLIIGIPVAFWIERKLENRRSSETRQQNIKKTESLLARVLVQVANADLRLKYSQNIEQKPFLIYLSFHEVEVIESLHKELTFLDADWDVLLSLDIVISSLKSLNGLLSINRETFALTFENKNPTMRPYSEKFGSELNFQITLVSESIKDYRKLTFEKYSDLMKHFEANFST